MDWDELRGMRDTRLAEMDKYQLAIPYAILIQGQKAELIQYRQDLLDLPQNYSSPEQAMANMPQRPTWFN